MRVVSVTPIIDEQDYYDITVEGTHNFLLADGSIVHNCGTGVGFSVESQFVSKLPIVPKDLQDAADQVIVFEDSRIGWAGGFREYVSSLYAGRVPRWDLSKLRAAGVRLKTFGGRASGPEPLADLLVFTRDLFLGARGRRLTTLECHDLVCKIADIVVVGGVRRSALISLSDLEDTSIQYAKHGRWWETHPHRALANNSAVYTSKPGTGTYLREMLALYDSQSGERGIFNREAAQSKAALMGRDASSVVGTNPSLRAGTLVLLKDSIVPIERLEGKYFEVPVGNGDVAPATCRMSSPSAELLEITFASGRKHYATKEHKWPMIDGHKKSTEELISGDKVPTGTRSLPGTGDDWDEELGYLVGYWLGNGWVTTRGDDGRQQHGLCVPDRRADLVPRLRATLAKIGVDTVFPHRNNGTYEMNTVSNALLDTLTRTGIRSKYQDNFTGVFENSGRFLKGLLCGLIDSDGSISRGRVSFSSKNEKLRDLVADLAYFSGYRPTIKSVMRDIRLTKPNGKEYFYPAYTIHIARWGLGSGYRQKYDTVISVSTTGIYEPVWDLSVDHSSHTFVIPGVVTGNCGEILLRSKQMCNLSESVLRPGDNLETVKAKVTVATILGTLQASLTDFKYLSPEWKKNTEEERLLGVSLTGVMDWWPSVGEERAIQILQQARRTTVEVNAIVAQAIGIPASASITCVKPSGTVSQLVDSSSGIHARYAPYYIRTVRADNNDPMCKFLKDQGVPNEPDVTKPKHTTVFSFPKRSPEGAVCTKDMTAIDQLEMWKVLADEWCDHNPSTTIQVKEDEWVGVFSWMYNEWDAICGIALLPYSEHTYQQAPYQEITKEEYEKMVSEMPKIEWDKLREYESEDTTSGSQELACSSGSCEIVDIN